MSDPSNTTLATFVSVPTSVGTTEVDTLGDNKIIVHNNLNNLLANFILK